MTNNTNSSSSGKLEDIKESGRGLPTTNTQTPMPEVKPPKPADNSSNSNKK